MENKKISYITLNSDLYLLLSFSYIIYGLFFGFERIGMESFRIYNITNSTAIIICIVEIVFCTAISYMLHKINIKSIRYNILILCILNIIYRIINIIILSSIFSWFMLIMGLILFITLLLY